MSEGKNAELATLNKTVSRQIGQRGRVRLTAPDSRRGEQKQVSAFKRPTNLSSIRTKLLNNWLVPITHISAYPFYMLGNAVSGCVIIEWMPCSLFEERGG